MFDDLVGPSKLELAETIKNLAIENAALQGALLELLEEKGILEASSFEKRIAKWKALADQELSKEREKLLNSDTPEGEKLRMRQQTIDTLNQLFKP